MLEWTKLLCAIRRQKRNQPPSTGEVRKDEDKQRELRTEIERDYDRILFSTPVRRLADKTQVFPLERNDSVRTRLTHSHEVSNLARSVGVALAYNTALFEGVPTATRDVPAMLAAIGLAHDLGNPPFGHQGEKAISDWFERELSKSPAEPLKASDGLTEQMRTEFLKFEGNAQTLRVVTKLQLLNDGRGLNLTLGTLGALMKYPVAAHQTQKSSASRKKFNYFISEQEVVEEIRSSTGLSEGVRHPLTFIMEACDDIAYSILDIEDSVKKGLVSVSDVISWLEHVTGKATPSEKQFIEGVLSRTKIDFDRYRREDLSPAEFNDATMQKLRVHAIGAMIGAVIERFTDAAPAMLAAKYDRELLADTSAGRLREELKNFSFRHAYQHRSVLALELQGHAVIQDLMSIFWDAIRAIKEIGNASPFQRYAYGRISENYRRVADSESSTSCPPRYHLYRLLADMISGMTDGYAVDLHREFQKLNAPISGH